MYERCRCFCEDLRTVPVGKDQETRKAPLKLVPIIKEVFSRVCIDTVGPLPCSGKGSPGYCSMCGIKIPRGGAGGHSVRDIAAYF
ncbi:hypothetical protein JTE90_020338 [Oedothorax gibbosus]|uniref:Uncharacterized protein n=1 Tax=Oedothorax gibbosus TaxID=931172 RepID=A0AAV6VPH0_9ARAC|nr:hypothetical protein JTE90_020338 [Oedothorax gibbosus]